MAAAVQSRPNATNSPHLSNAKSMTQSPRSNRNSLDAPKKENSAGDSKQDQSSSLPTIKQPDSAESKEHSNAGPANAPLAPPPKPSQNGDSDYFTGPHSQSHFSKEPNVFENAFGNPSETPGKSTLPGVASLTSPAPLLPGSTPGWPGSLRSGPLSPAMLTGPTGTNDYFNGDHHFPGSFPTPNESSLRTGLTPGGGGSMFPQPSPNSQAFINQLQSGGATPGTLDFHRTAMTARAQSQANPYLGQNIPTSQAQQQNSNIQPDLDSKPYSLNNKTSAPQQNHDPFGPHQTDEAANGLYMLAQAGGQQRNPPGYPMQQQSQQSYSQSAPQGKQGGKASIGSNMSGSTDEHYSDEADNKAQSRGGRGAAKKGAANKAAANGKRKTDEGSAKGPANKRARGSMSEEPEDDDDMQDQDMGNSDKKMTDEEKRKNFLERNRVAALKCRQRKKQWLANLQQKVEIFSTENDALAATVTQLREEIVGLKTLLLAHKDCPVSQAQGITSMQMQQIAGDTQHYANPYGMAMGPGGSGMQQGQMPAGNMSRN